MADRQYIAMIIHTHIWASIIRTPLTYTTVSCPAMFNIIMEVHVLISKNSCQCEGVQMGQSSGVLFKELELHISHTYMHAQSNQATVLHASSIIYYIIYTACADHDIYVYNIYILYYIYIYMYIIISSVFPPFVSNN